MSDQKQLLTEVPVQNVLLPEETVETPDLLVESPCKSGDKECHRRLFQALSDCA